MKEVKKQHKAIRNHNRREDAAQHDTSGNFLELSEAPTTVRNVKSVTKVSKASLGDRLAKEGFTSIVTGTGGNKEMKFSMRKKTDHDTRKIQQKHFEERKKIARKTGFLHKKRLPKY